MTQSPPDDDPAPLTLHTFTFGKQSLIVECRKTLNQTNNFRLTVQCEHRDIWESLRDFGGCLPSSDDDDTDCDTNRVYDTPPPQQQEQRQPDLLGLDIWPAAIELCNYLSNHPTLVTAAPRCLELGAGVGLPGLLAAKLSPTTHVVLTDYEPQVVAHVARNASLNNLPSPKQLSGLCLDWTKLPLLPPHHCHAYPLLLAADVLYIADIMPGFVDAVDALLAPSLGRVIIGHQTRRALVLDETKTPVMVDDDVAFREFQKLCQAKGLVLRELGQRESPFFPGPMLLIALGRREEDVQDLPPAFL